MDTVQLGLAMTPALVCGIASSGSGESELWFSAFKKVRLADAKDDGILIIWCSLMRYVSNIEDLSEVRRI